jgi:hypothetical protein
MLDFDRNWGSQKTPVATKNNQFDPPPPTV